MAYKWKNGKLEHDQDRVDRFVKSCREACDPIDRAEFLRAAASGKPQVIHTFIAHDDWCNTMKTGRGGDCNCNPEISYGRQRP